MTLRDELAPVTPDSDASGPAATGVDRGPTPRRTVRVWTRTGARAVALGLLALGLVSVWWWWQGRPAETVAPPEAVATGAPLTGLDSATSAAPASHGTTAGEVVVHVVGQVVRPGVVRLPAGSRVLDAVRAAGGVRPDGRLGAVNLARVLVDGEQIVVGPAARRVPGPSATGAGSAPLDLNRATAAELESLPGVGPVLAARIVEWRTVHGRFTDVAELREVSGIGDAVFARIAPGVRV